MAVEHGSAFGASIAFTTTSFAPKITSVSVDGMERGDVETSHLGLTVYDSGVSAFRTFAPGGLIDGGTLTLGWRGHMDEEPPISKVAETITLTLANTGSSSDATLAFSGYVKSYSYNGDDETAYEGQIVLKIAGDITWTDPT